MELHDGKRECDARWRMADVVSETNVAISPGIGVGELDRDLRSKGLLLPRSAHRTGTDTLLGWLTCEFHPGVVAHNYGRTTIIIIRINQELP